MRRDTDLYYAYYKAGRNEVQAIRMTSEGDAPNEFKILLAGPARHTRRRMLPGKASLSFIADVTSVLRAIRRGSYGLVNERQHQPRPLVTGLPTRSPTSSIYYSLKRACILLTGTCLRSSPFVSL